MRYGNLKSGTIIQCMVTRNDTYASRSGKCRHSQNEPKLRSHNITEPIIHKPSEFWTVQFMKEKSLVIEMWNNNTVVT